MLGQGRWNRTTRWLQLGAQAFGVYVLYRILISDTIAIVPFFTIVAKGIIVLVIVIVALEMVSLLYRLLFQRPFSSQSVLESR